MRNALLLGLIAAVGCSAPVAEPPPVVDGLDALKFTVTLDRQDYIHREGIFADWRVTNHGKTPIGLVHLHDPDDAVVFQVRNGQGKLVTLDTQTIVCYRGNRPLPVKTLRPGESLHGSIDLYNTFYGWSGPGVYTLEASFFASTPAGDESSKRVVSCPAGEFTVHRPQGDDAFAANLILQRMGAQAATDVNQDTRPGLVRWGYEVCEDLIGKGKSRRFAALAHLVSGQRLLPPWQLPNETVSDEAASRAEQHLLACMQSDGASPYMKALAYYELVRLAKLTAPRVPRHEIIRMAQALNRQYPNTFMAWQMTRILDELQASYK